MTGKKPLGLQPLDYHTIFTNIFEPIIVDNPTEQEEYFKKKIIEALEDLPKPKKVLYVGVPKEKWYYDK